MSKKAQYMLRTCKADMTSYNGFKWQEKGAVVAPDWDPSPVCGKGLHGFLSGCGKGELANWNDDAVWMVCRIDWLIVDLGGKVKTDKCTVVHCGDRKTATDKIRKLCGDGPIVGCFYSGGHGATVSGGDEAIIQVKYYDGDRYRMATGYVGEDGIKPNTPYRVVDGKLTEVVK